MKAILFFLKFILKNVGGIFFIISFFLCGKIFIHFVSH